MTNLCLGCDVEPCICLEIDGSEFDFDIGHERMSRMFDVEYVDPEESKCEECGSSFEVHLMKCSKFVSPRAGQTCRACDCKIGNDGGCGCNPAGA